MKFLSVVKMGRLSDGCERDHGSVRHAMDEGQYSWGTHHPSLCGSKPGRRSVGYVNDEEITEITCSKCLKRINALQED